MRLPDCCEEIKSLNESCLWLAKDIIVLDENRDDLADWLNGCVDQYNGLIDDLEKNSNIINKNFHQLDERTKKLEEDRESQWDLPTRIFSLCIWNLILTIALLIHVFW